MINQKWNKIHLGFDTSPYGTSFEWRQIDDSTKKGLTQWEKTQNILSLHKRLYAQLPGRDFLEALVEELKKENVTIVDKIESYDYGKFVHILDPKGNKIELWEPKD